MLAWVLRIAANCVTDYRRRLKPQVSLEEDDSVHTLRLVAPSAEGEAMRREKIQAVRQALGTLSEGDRQIIYLAHQNDMSSAQIAQVLEKPSISAVTSHLHRAMKHLRTALERGWFEESVESPQGYAASSRKVGNGH